MTWLVAAGLAAPFSVVLHELGHFLAAMHFEFGNPRLHWSAVSYDESEAFWTAMQKSREAAAQILDPTNVGLVSFSGIAVTWVLTLLSLAALTATGFRSVAGAFFATLALTGGVRALPGLIYIVSVRPNHPDAWPNFDEFVAATALGWPVDALVFGGIVLTVFSWLVIVPKLAPSRWVKLAGVAAGYVGGVALWQVVGPAVLP